MQETPSTPLLQPVEDATDNHVPDARPVALESQIADATDHTPERWWLDLWLDAASVFAEFTAWVAPVALFLALRPAEADYLSNATQFILLTFLCMGVFVGFRRLAKGLARRSRLAIFVAMTLTCFAAMLPVLSLSGALGSTSDADPFGTRVFLLELLTAFVILFWCLRQLWSAGKLQHA